MRGVMSPFPQYAFMAWFSFKAQGQLYFYSVAMTFFDGKESTLYRLQLNKVLLNSQQLYIQE
jgi:hypothetical protein